MNDIVISAKGLAKKFDIYNNPVDLAKDFIFGGTRHKIKWALKDINLEIGSGHVVGILGRNGAGKSTLLKLLAGTLYPTKGYVYVKGKISAILELGTAFHPEFTGKENIYMEGLCMGMGRAEISEKLDWIINFSELNDYIDQPLKTYSTGMRARLAFSTAISVKPEVLIVDEALSVGDAKFQAKCFNEIRSLKNNGNTILFVSHDPNSVGAICDEALIIEEGLIHYQGNPLDVSREYQKLLFGSNLNKNNNVHKSLVQSQNDQADEITSREVNRYGDKSIQILEWYIMDEQGNKVNVINSGTKCAFYSKWKVNQDIGDLTFGWVIRNKHAIEVFGVTNNSLGIEFGDLSAGEIIEHILEINMWLADGEYFISLGGAHLSNGEKCDYIDSGIGIKVNGPIGLFRNSLVNLEPEYKYKKNNPL